MFNINKKGKNNPNSAKKEKLSGLTNTDKSARINKIATNQLRKIPVLKRIFFKIKHLIIYAILK